ncbi:MAG: hypothetical protein M1820_006641 [Bogoriella megaspora]|nr:MAG: hypothetical protein M1820_006641 [Bogoriella megaspora]
MRGKFVRYGPNRVSVNSSTALREIYNVKANVRKSKVYTAVKYFFKDGDMSMTVLDTKRHAYRRRVNVQALRPDAVEVIQDHIIKNIDYFCSHVIAPEPTSEWGVPHDFSKIVGYLVSDIMGDVTFSKNWDTQRDATYRHFVDDSALGTAGMHIIGHLPFVVKYGLHHILFRPFVNGVQRLNALSKRITEWRVAQKDIMPGQDLFPALLQVTDFETGKGFTSAELTSEAGLFIVAGTDTTVTATVSTLFYLLKSPDCMKVLQKEIRTRFASVERIRVSENLTNSCYLMACIDEALRLTPPVGSILPREVLPGGIFIDGEYFLEGIDIGVPHYALHRHEDYFTDPDAYCPLCWFDESGKYIPATAHPAFTAFGVGRTSCVGKYLAYQEISLVIAWIFWLYDIRLDPESDFAKQSPQHFPTRDRFVSMHQGPVVQFKSRF